MIKIFCFVYVSFEFISSWHHLQTDFIQIDRSACFRVIGHENKHSHAFLNIRVFRCVFRNGEFHGVLFPFGSERELFERGEVFALMTGGSPELDARLHDEVASGFPPEGQQIVFSWKKRKIMRTDSVRTGRRCSDFKHKALRSAQEGVVFDDFQ